LKVLLVQPPPAEAVPDTLALAENDASMCADASNSAFPPEADFVGRLAQFVPPLKRFQA
jgi:hypothetical protein